MTAPVTVVSCLYGDSLDRFVDEWAAAIAALDPQPEMVIISADRPRDIPGATVIPAVCTWRHPQAYHLQAAISWATTEWVWIVDIDDLAIPNALAGLKDIREDVWQVGYLRSDGELHLPPQLAATEYLEEQGNPFAAGSMFRTDVFRAVGGFTDVAFQDWSLWRRMAQIGATFKASDRAHYRYRLHDDSRTATELRPERRTAHFVEMSVAEEFHAVA